MKLSLTQRCFFKSLYTRLFTYPVSFNFLATNQMEQKRHSVSSRDRSLDTIYLERHSTSQHLFRKTRSTTPTASQPYTNTCTFQDSVRALGILLPELCFGTVIEDLWMQGNLNTDDEQLLQGCRDQIGEGLAMPRLPFNVCFFRAFETQVCLQNSDELSSRHLEQVLVKFRVASLCVGV